MGRRRIRRFPPRSPPKFAKRTPPNSRRRFQKTLMSLVSGSGRNPRVPKLLLINNRSSNSSKNLDTLAGFQRSKESKPTFRSGSSLYYMMFKVGIMDGFQLWIAIPISGMDSLGMFRVSSKVRLSVYSMIPTRKRRLRSPHFFVVLPMMSSKPWLSHTLPFNLAYSSKKVW